MLNINQKIINSFTEICNHLEDSHCAILYGDCEISTIKTLISKYLQISAPIFKILDASEEDLSDLMNLVDAGSLDSKPMIILVDNVDLASKSNISDLIKTINKIGESDKYLLLLGLNLENIFIGIHEKCRKFRVGPTVSDQTSIKDLIQSIYTESDRIKVFNALEDSEYPLSYILSILAYNLPIFFKDLNLDLNTGVIEIASHLCNTTENTLIHRYLQYGLNIAKNKRVVQFPPRKKE
jgi:predicted house-cleaning noncanonical NTP pyrophosphatase (MazG superfamily)